jgi:hypothetical protein
MNTNIRNASSWELRALASSQSPLAQVAARILAEREAAEAQLSAICRQVAAENSCNPR